MMIRNHHERLEINRGLIYLKNRIQYYDEDSIYAQNLFRV
jgi:hypothetical protein